MTASILRAGAFLKIDAKDSRETIAATRRGVAVTAVDELVKSGRASLAEIDRLVLPRKTLSHRRKSGVLTPKQSDRLIRFARAIAAAEEIRLAREGGDLASTADSGARRSEPDLVARHRRGQPRSRTSARQDRPRPRGLMRVWRVCRRPFADLSGEGARLYGGRGNCPAGRWSTPLSRRRWPSSKCESILISIGGCCRTIMS